MKKLIHGLLSTIYSTLVFTQDKPCVKGEYYLELDGEPFKDKIYLTSDDVVSLRASVFCERECGEGPVYSAVSFVKDNIMYASFVSRGKEDTQLYVNYILVSNSIVYMVCSDKPAFEKGKYEGVLILKIERDNEKDKWKEKIYKQVNLQF